ncbi:MAG TPA: zinc ribbon domain-containing protein [Blastocatellia bacterium]|nr:zinc ribbon domain-containing protein [Blastocatellia bacterium]
MYCPNCAAPHSHGLRYCKQCGTSLLDKPQTSALAPPATAPKVTGAAWALAMATVAIVLGGLGIITSNAFDLMRTFPGETRTGNPTPVAIVMLVFGSLTVFGVVFLLMRLFTHLMVTRQHGEASPAGASHTLTAAPPPVQLPAPPSAIGSVTEHTTRNFEPSVYDKLRARE